MNITCKICGNKTTIIFAMKVLNKYNVSYFFCENCKLLQTEEPYWLEEAYKEPINLSDTGLVQRNNYLSRKVSIILFSIFGAKGKYLDYAGGYGLFVRLMRDIGFDFYWIDLHTPNLFAKGFEYCDKDNIDAITTFETFEHFVDPIEEIGKIVKISPNIIFTTELLPNKIPEPKNWWYYGLDHGQHVSFYSPRTLAFIAKKYKLNFITDGNIHIFTKKRINRFLYSFLLKTSGCGGFKFIKKKVLSKTLSDMELLKHNLY